MIFIKYPYLDFWNLEKKLDKYTSHRWVANEPQTSHNEALDELPTSCI